MKKVLKDSHSGTKGAHLEQKKILERLKQSCYQAVKYWITNCTQCIVDKGPIRGGQGQLQQKSLGAFLKKIAMINDRTKARYDRVENTLELLCNPTKKPPSYLPVGMGRIK